jgi:MarR family transcriptional regulator, organic hydroperoxide resistance regulator
MVTRTGSGGRERRRLPVLLKPEELDLRTWIQMVRTSGKIERRLEQALEGHGLSISQFDILATLGIEQGITQQDLAECLLVTKGNICGMIDRMEASGWVERRSDPEDRRANRLFLTRRGKTLLAQTFPEQQAMLKEIMSALTPGELQSLYQYLDRLDEAADD